MPFGEGGVFRDLGLGLSLGHDVGELSGLVNADGFYLKNGPKNSGCEFGYSSARKRRRRTTTYKSRLNQRSKGAWSLGQRLKSESKRN